MLGIWKGTPQNFVSIITYCVCKEGGTFLQMRRERLLGLVVIAGGPSQLLLVWPRPLGQRTKGPTALQRSPALRKSHREPKQEALIFKVPGQVPERRIYTVAKTYLCISEQYVTARHPWFRVINDQQLQQGIWQCGEEQKLSGHSYENASKPFRKKLWRACWGSGAFGVSGGRCLKE